MRMICSTLNAQVLVAALGASLVAFSPQAALTQEDIAPNVSDLQGARASSGERTMQQRGYTVARQRGLTAFWTHPKGGCVRTVTANGRYRTVEPTVLSNCGKAAATRTAAQPKDDGGDTAPIVSDLRGARASSGERVMQQRGYTVARQRGLTSFWTHPKGGCVRTVTANGRYQTVEPTVLSDCGKAAATRTAAQPKDDGGDIAPNVMDLRGTRASSGERAMEERGYTVARQRGLTAYWTHPKGGCVRTVTGNGRYQTVEPTVLSNCRTAAARTAAPARTATPAGTSEPTRATRQIPGSAPILGLRPSHFNGNDAIRACRQRLGEQYHARPRAITNEKFDEDANGAFKVTGNISRHTQRPDVFNCRVVHGEVTSLRVHPQDKPAAAIGKAVLGAVLLGVAEATGNTAADNQPHPAYTRGNPFRNRNHLKAACRHEIARKLRHSHARFNWLRMASAHLRNRTLQGDAGIRWHGTTHRLHYVCHFDRRGRVVDGQFYYYPAQERMYAPVALTPGNAQPPAWRVKDVASNDVLYVHQDASLASPRIGSLPYNATGVQVFACEWSDVDQGTWCEIEYKGMRGFAARMYLEKQS